MAALDSNQLQIKKKIEEISLKNFNELVGTTPLEELSEFLKILSEDIIKDSKKMTLILFSSLEDRNSIEKLAKFLSAPLFITLLTHRNEIENSKTNKITSILVGLPVSVFNKVLMDINPHDLAILQNEATTEPLQHQLTLFIHEVIHHLELITDELRSLEAKIDQTANHRMTRSLLTSLIDDIEQVAKKISDTIHKINQALVLAWNTQREDLIEALSFQKECWSKYEKLVIGFDRLGSRPPKGLYARLEELLSQVFLNQNKDDCLQDHEPAIEALAKFSLWYLVDYWELGLLPKIHSKNDLELDPEHYTVQQRADYQAELLLTVRKNLEAHGLKNILDLKINKIFSKELLVDYLKRTC